ncbi:MAG: M20/M25/M40 family metallo-hydrolase [Gemmatimonadaceae bacterium]
MRTRSISCSLTSALAATSLAAQQPTAPTDLDALATWIVAPAATGRERVTTDAIMRAVPGWTRDGSGNLIMHRGSGTPRRVIACTLDNFSFFVSEITADGYLRLHDPLGTRPSAMWDQFYEGQRIRVQTARGAVAGVVGVRSTHLWRRRSADSALANVEQFYVDVGAKNAAEVHSLGIAMLDPVLREWPLWTYAGHVAGPGAAARAGCAAIAAAARGTPARGESIFIIAALGQAGNAGLVAALTLLGPVDSVAVAGLATTDSSIRHSTASRAAARGAFDISIHARFDASHAESVSDTGFAQMRRRVESYANVVQLTGPLPALSLRAGPHDASATAFDASDAPIRLGGADRLGEVSRVLGTLTNVYAVSGHEQRMRDAVVSMLPAWAKAKAVTDTAGNIVIAAGPDRDTALFVAHMDELGHDITRINADGSVALRARGGFFASLWEGQPALLHLDSGEPVRGIFVPRDGATTRQPRELTAWFGLDSAALVARGAHIGSALTFYKRATRLGATRFTARAIDDRAGCAAQLLALRAIAPGALDHKVIFIFSTREEIGLEGAHAVANQLGASVHRVYAIDTFVSSDSPLESQRFANTPIGNGAVVRALDNSSVTPADEIAAVLAIARAAGIAVQVGTTNGGNDGSTFVPHGAIDIPLAWPLRYSHSPAEVVDLADIDGLARLIAAIAIHHGK